MADEPSRFTSDRRARGEASWAGQADWGAGIAEGVDVTVDGLVGRTPAQEGETPDGVVYDFETGDLSNWDDVNELQTSTSRSYIGEYSGFCQDGQTGTHQARTTVYVDGGQPSSLRYYWNEASRSGGSGVRFINSNGDVEFGIGTNNPEWVIDDADGRSEESGSDGYDRWIEFHVPSIDWGLGTFDIKFIDMQTGKEHESLGRPLKHGVDIEDVEINTYGNGGWQDGSSIYAYLDNIEFIG